MAIDPIAALLGAGMVPSVSFPPTSRYVEVGVATYVRIPSPGEDPVPIAYLRRRLVPPPERFALLYEYTCVERDRRDNVAATNLSDAQVWWRLADANGVIDPQAMTSPVGRVLRITTAVNIPGAT
jgi:hypothetical protein